MSRITKIKHLILPNPKYFIYFIELIGTGHFYIGMTSNPQRREMDHYNCIRRILLENKRHDFMCQIARKNKKGFVASEGKKVHRFFASKIYPKVNHFVSPGKTITWHYTFSVKHSCYTIEEAMFLESEYLSLAKGNPLCLNDQMTSQYKS